MKSSVKLTGLDQVRALADPLRFRILEALAKAPMTTKQVAQQLGENPTKLYHHVDLLERAGLIALVATRKKRGAEERYYQAVAKEIAIDRRLLKIAPEGAQALETVQDIFTKTLQATLDEINKSMSSELIGKGNSSDEFPTVLARAHVTLTPEQARQLTQKLQNWVAECKGTTGTKSNGAKYGMTVMLYPVRKGPRKKSGSLH